MVTGENGCGKTTACQRAIDLLRARGVTVSGILSLPRLDASGARTGIDALDMATGERRCLAKRVSGGGKTVGDYTFNRPSLDWAVGRLMAAVACLRRAGPANVLVVDEVGPLELVQGGGFVAVLDPLADPSLVPRGLVVVRREYLEVFERRISRPDVRRFWVDEACREYVPGEIAAAYSTV